MLKDTIFFDEKTKETGDVFSDMSGKESDEFLDKVFSALEQVNKERRVFSDTLKSYYMNYAQNAAKDGFAVTNVEKGLFELLSKTSEGLDKKWKISQKTVKNWFAYSEYSMTKQNSKIFFFQVAFAFGLSRDEVKKFFMKLFGGVPAFTRNPVDLIFEYCFANKKTFKDAVEMLEVFEELISIEYENAFENAYSSENINHLHFYASAMNCNCNCVSLFNYLINYVEDKEIVENFLRNNDISSYLRNLIENYEEVNCKELNRKSLEETAITLVSSKGLINKYIRRESRDNTRIISWKDGKGTPELTDSFSDRILMYALIKKLELNKEQISNLILLSAKSKAQRFLKNQNRNDLSVTDSIKEYIRLKKDPMLPAACAEDIEIFSYLYFENEVSVNREKREFFNTHGENSIEDLFELESDKFIKKMLELRLEFSVNNVRARTKVIEYIKKLSETETALKLIMRYFNSADSDIKKCCRDTMKQHLEKKKSKSYVWYDQKNISKSYFPWFWVAVIYGFFDDEVLSNIFVNARNEINEIYKKIKIFEEDKSQDNLLFKYYCILQSKTNGSQTTAFKEFLFDQNVFSGALWEDYLDYCICHNKIDLVIKYKYPEICEKAVVSVYERDMRTIFKNTVSDEETTDWKRFLCDAFKNMPSPSFIAENQFEAGKGNMNTYEQLRSLLIILHFFVFYKSKDRNFEDYRFEINTLLTECGFSTLYSKEPLDFLLLACAQSKSPVKSFSALWNLALKG